jgi:hypothetical protein
MACKRARKPSSPFIKPQRMDMAQAHGAREQCDLAPVRERCDRVPVRERCDRAPVRERCDRTPVDWARHASFTNGGNRFRATRESLCFDSYPSRHDQRYISMARSESSALLVRDDPRRSARSRSTPAATGPIVRAPGRGAARRRQSTDAAAGGGLRVAGYPALRVAGYMGPYIWAARTVSRAGHTIWAGYSPDTGPGRALRVTIFKLVTVSSWSSWSLFHAGWSGAAAGDRSCHGHRP